MVIGYRQRISRIVKNVMRLRRKSVFIIGNCVCMKRGIDAERFIRYFIANGYEIVESPDDADLIFIITCAFTEKFVNSGVKLIQDLSVFKGRKIVFGCMPSMAPNKFRKVFKGVYLVTKDINKIDTLFPSFKTRFAEIHDGFQPYYPAISGRMLSTSLQKNAPSYEPIKPPVNPILLICEGCLGNCSYCAHPKALGRLKSKPIETCVEDYRRILNLNYGTTQIHGNDTGAYGLDINSSLPELLHALIQIENDTNVKWILSDINPKWLLKYRDDLEYFIDIAKVVSLGVPIQSGSDKILHRMRRKGKIDDILSVLKYLKSNYPKLKISTHLIVGFPGESEDDFSSTLSLFDDNLFHSALLFKYSNSEVTNASTLDGHVPEDIINERIQRAKNEVGTKVHTLRVFD